MYMHNVYPNGTLLPNTTQMNMLYQLMYIEGTIWKEKCSKYIFFKSGSNLLIDMSIELLEILIFFFFFSRILAWHDGNKWFLVTTKVIRNKLTTNLYKILWCEKLDRNDRTNYSASEKNNSFLFVLKKTLQVTQEMIEQITMRSNMDEALCLGEE